MAILSLAGKSITTGLITKRDSACVILSAKSNISDDKKNQVNNTPDENPNFKRKYKAKGTQIAILQITKVKVDQYFRFTGYPSLVELKSSVLNDSFYCPKRGPPKV
ncbi:hypothetical protein CNR22_18445 [Sphingobacteriaceae bacterium]|nr:hypothetical protein CNR22_18445 [Sphingobacteriaceae bacterium]